MFVSALCGCVGFFLCNKISKDSVADPDIPFRGVGGGGHEIRLNAKGTVGNFEGRKLIYNKIIPRKM